jgi:sigma-B regulation protein RsbU (phosphoserine phosphatase)
VNVAGIVLQAIVDAAIEGTEASGGWLVVHDGDRLQVVAAAGDGLQTLVGSSVSDAEGTVGFVVASGQPLALNAPRADDDRLAGGVNGLAGRVPTAVLCVPCVAGNTVVGALEVVDKLGGGAFAFADIEVASLLAAVGAAAVAEGVAPRSVAAPEELGRDLQRLSEVDPVRYAAVATALDALLGGA